MSRWRFNEEHFFHTTPLTDHTSAVLNCHRLRRPRLSQEDFLDSTEEKAWLEELVSGVDMSV